MLDSVTSENVPQTDQSQTVNQTEPTWQRQFFLSFSTRITKLSKHKAPNSMQHNYKDTQIHIRHRQKFINFYIQSSITSLKSVENVRIHILLIFRCSFL